MNDSSIWQSLLEQGVAGYGPVSFYYRRGSHKFDWAQIPRRNDSLVDELIL